MAKYLELSADVIVDLSSLFGKNLQAKPEDNKNYPNENKDKEKNKEEKK